MTKGKILRNSGQNTTPKKTSRIKSKEGKMKLAVGNECWKWQFSQRKAKYERIQKVNESLKLLHRDLLRLKKLRQARDKIVMRLKKQGI